MAVFKHLTVKELYASIPNTETISQMMKDGIEQGSTQLAVSAMEELILREDLDKVFCNLDWAVHSEALKLGTSMSTMIARSLMEAHGADKILRRMGKGLLKEDIESMYAFLRAEDAE